MYVIIIEYNLGVNFYFYIFYIIFYHYYYNNEPSTIKSKTNITINNIKIY